MLNSVSVGWRPKKLIKNTRDLYKLINNLHKSLTQDFKVRNELNFFKKSHNSQKKVNDDFYCTLSWYTGRTIVFANISSKQYVFAFLGSKNHWFITSRASNFQNKY